MMTRFLFLSMFCFFHTVLLAQTPNRIIDSLLVVLEIAKEDTNKVNTLNDLAHQSRINGENEKAMQYGNSALSLAEKINFKHGEIGALRNIGKINAVQGNLPEAMENFIAALKISEEIGAKLGIGDGYISIGNIHTEQGNYPEAMESYNTAIQILKEIGDKEGMAASYSNIGNIHDYLGNYPEALENYSAALKIYNETGSKYGLSVIHNNIGTTYAAQGHFPEALENYSISLKMKEEIGDKEGIANAYNNIGAVLDFQGNYPKALEYYYKSLEILESIGYKRGIAGSYNNIGLIYEKQENYTKALENHLTALKIEQEIGDKRGMGESYNNMGYNYLNLGNLTEAFKSHLTALNIYEEIEEPAGIAFSYKKLGAIYANQINYPEALNHYLKSLKIFEEIGNLVEIAHTNVEIGHVLSDQAAIESPPASLLKYNEAIEYLNKGLLLSREIESNAAAQRAYEVLSQVYERMNDFKKALEYNYLYVELKDSLLNNETTQKLEQLRTQYEVEKAVAGEKVQQEKLLAEQIFLSNKKFTEENALHELKLAEERAQQDKALAIEKVRYEFTIAEERSEQEQALFEQKIISEKTLTEENARHQLALAEEKARQEQKDAAETARLESEKAERKRRSEMLITGVALLGIISLFVILFVRQRNLKRRAIERAETVHKMAELELQSLRAQLNPHFMFNSLNAIQELILMEENDKSHTYLARFAKLLRMLLENANSPFIPLARELEFLELYLSLENLRIPDLKYSIHKDPDIDAEQIKIPNMILQPYIENAIWHGLSHKKVGERKIQLRVLQQADGVKYEIEDNGVGRKKAAELKSVYRKAHRSKGMELLTKRFKLLSEEYRFEIKTSVTDIMNKEEVTGTIVTINVPWGLARELKRLAS